MARPFSAPRAPREVDPFSWEYWRLLHDGFRLSGWRSQERWQLAYLHSPCALMQLARVVQDGCSTLSSPTAVSVQSVWIDGTPQVTGFLPSGQSLARCELADLLLIVNLMDTSGTTVRRTGLLLQGKTAKRHNALPSNHSTKKERLLLEGLDRTKPLSVFRDIALKSSIGTYTFGGGTGLNDCARYLVMAKTMAWDDCPICAPLSPLQIGWPKKRSVSSIAPTTSFVDALRQLAMTGNLGRLIFDKGSSSFNCEWSRLVWDLLGDYEPVEMRGYGGQNRVNAASTWRFMALTEPRANLPPANVPVAPESFDRPPAISVLQVNIRSGATDR